MLFDLLKLLPQDAGGGTVIIAMIGAIVGVAFWIAGVKLSRPIVTLATVLLGAGIGLQLPRWFGWSISGAGPAVGGAIALGVTGFALHRMWIGLSLGLLLAVWSVLAIWLSMHGNRQWTWPPYEESVTLCSYSKSAWESVPQDMSRLMPWACAVAIISALAAAILWPRLTTVVHWSALGLSMMIGLGVSALMLSQRSDWLARAPQQTWTQLGSLLVMLVLGAGIQWKLSRSPAKSPAAPKKPDDPQ